MRRLSRCAEAMRPGTVVATVLCPLESDLFDLVDEVGTVQADPGLNAPPGFKL